jgi:hypothetical protein
VRVADGSPADDPADPTALSGLAVTWGRDSTVDQPAPSTCVFDLLDSPDGLAFADILATGTEVRVTATGTVYAAPSIPTWADGGFEAGAPHAAPYPYTVVGRSSRRANTGAYSAVIHASTAAPPHGVAAVLAPAAFVPAGTNPGAWDGIPATATGQRWGFTAAVFAAPGSVATVRPVLFTGPYADAYVVRGPVLEVAGDGAWHVLAGTFTPDLPGAWVGVQITAPGASARTWDQAAGTWDEQAPGWTWDDWRDTYADDVQVTAPTGGAPSTVLVFDGRVTDLEASWDEATGLPLLRVTAADFTAALGNVDVGDEPWTVEAMSARFARILTATGLPIGVQVDPSVGAIPVTARDVDRQPAGALLSDLAASVDGVMWSAVHQVSGPYLWVEDQATRPPGEVLALVGGVVVIEESSAGALALSACDVLRDPVTMHQNVADVVTRASVGWTEQSVDMTEHTVDVIDAGREGDGFGVRRLGLSTQLTTAGDATTVANRILARTAQGWRAHGLTVDDGLPATDDQATETARLLELLDGTSRLALPMRLTELPGWLPNAPEVGVYLEGGRYRFEGGRWVLELTVSNAAGAGADAAWDGLPAPWQWNQFEPAITWDAMRGVGVAT